MNSGTVDAGKQLLCGNTDIFVSVGDALLNSSVTDVRKANANTADGEGKVPERN